MDKPEFIEAAKRMQEIINRLMADSDELAEVATDLHDKGVGIKLVMEANFYSLSTQEKLDREKEIQQTAQQTKRKDDEFLKSMRIKGGL
jgi:hypothetical protein